MNIHTFLIVFFGMIVCLKVSSNDDLEKLSKKEVLERLIETDLIKEKYQTCVEAKNPEPWNCVWNELKPDEQKQVSEILGRFTDEDQNKEENETRYEGKGLGLFDEKSDPVLKELGNNLFDMFQKAMYGEYTNEVRDQELRVIDHAVFYEIYKARISKEFIELIASFCLDSTLNGRVYTVSEDEESLKQTREDNIKQLHSNPEKEKTKFNLCIMDIKNICTHKAQGGSCQAIGEGANKIEISCAADENTQNRACEVQQAVNGIKKSIAATEVIQDEIEKMKKENGNAGSLGNAISGRKLSIYTGGKMDDRQSVDSLTTITSGQLEEAMKVDDETTIFDKASKELEEECSESLTKRCKEFVLEGDEIKNQRDKIAEMGLRMLAMEKRVKDNLKGAENGDEKSKEELAQFLKEEGINEEEIEAILKDDKKVRIVTKEILANYAARKDAVINNLQNKLAKMVPEEDTDEAKLSVITKVTKELMDRPKKYKQLMHYSNIVSSYLSATSTGDGANQNEEQNLNVDQDGQTDDSGRYKTAAAKELGQLGSEYAEVAEDIAEKVGVEADEAPESDEEGLISIGLDTINNLLYREVLDGEEETQ